MSSKICGEAWVKYALCSCDPESESQSMGSPSRRRDLGDFDCRSFAAVSQITETF
jgi:hypothetical protein